MTIPYAFYPRLVVRTPCRSFQTRSDSFDLDALCQDDAFLEAIFLASPVLHAELLKYRDGQIDDRRAIRDLSRSAGKYFLRMSSRCTPFGLFSGCGVAGWSEERDSLVVADSHDRHTRIDMHYLCALAQHLAELPFVRERLRYCVNSSCYRIGEEMRYVEYSYVDGKRVHQLSAVAYSDYLAILLAAAQAGADWAGLIGRLVAEEIAVEEAVGFVGELIGAQVLVHELEPAITGEEFLPQMIAVLERIGGVADAATGGAADAAAGGATDSATGGATAQLVELCGLLRELHVLVSALDGAGALVGTDAEATRAAGTNGLDRYQEVKTLIARLGVPFDEARLFQADTVLRLADGRVSEGLQAELLEAMDVLNHLNKRPENPTLTAFIRRFTERYEQREMPLLEVLDTETGIGYLEHFPGDIVPLIDDVVTRAQSGEEGKINWSKRESWLMRKLTEALAYGAAAIELSREELSGFENDWEQLPPSMAVLFRPLAEDRFLLEGSGGSSAIPMLGRFAHGHPAIDRLVRDVVAEEEALNPDILFAEIVHLPESRTGNVLLHPAFRRYEIPFLAKASAEAADCISPSDLLISVRGERIVLRSMRLNKEIIPRLSNAHNWTDRALPVYQFLCDLQSHSKQFGIFFRWGVLEKRCRFLPRVEYKRFIISPAQWNFEQRDIAHLKGAEGRNRGGEGLNGELEGADFGLAVQAFRERWRLPAQVVLAEGDNELYLNLDDERMVDIWWDAVRNRPGFVLKEFLAPGGAQAVRDSAGRVYTSQMLAVLLRTKPAYEAATVARGMKPVAPHVLPPPVLAPQADFSVGSDWVYFKLYCGERTADRLLVEAVHPLVAGWLETGKIDRFFFIRYKDPAFHLRVRVHLNDIAWIGTVLESFGAAIREFEKEGRIWKVQLDTYKRELERYGPGSIGLAEEFFFHDSLAVLELLTASEGMDRDELRWQWALRSIDEFLDLPGWGLAEKQALMAYMKDAFHREFQSDKVLRSQLSGKWRTSKGQVEAILDRSRDELQPWRQLLLPLRKRREGLAPIVDQLRRMDAEQLYSYVHMLVNRIVPSDPRKHELVLYDLLFTYYRSMEQRAKYQEKNSKKILSAV